MGIIRVEKNTNYSVISNVHLQDKTLSWKAKGLLSFLLSKPDSWTILMSHLVKQSRDGTDSVRTTIKELLDNGYMTREYARNDIGQIIGRDYVVYENPITVNNKTAVKPANPNKNKGNIPKSENPISGKPTSGNPLLLNTDRIQSNTEVIKNERLQPSPSVLLKDSKEPLQNLISILPPKHQTSHIIKLFIERALTQHSFDDIKASILYTKDKAKGNATQFKSYLGKCLDNKWYSGYQEAIEAERIEIERLKAEKLLKEITERQETLKKEKQEQTEREKLIEEEERFNAIDKEELDNFIKKELWGTLTSFEKKQFKSNRNLIRRLKYKLYLKNKELIE